MASLVGGAFLSATVQTLVEKLASKELRDYIRNTKLNESLLRELATTLLALQVVLDDAEEKQIVNTAIKQWLDQLRDAIFDAEDLLDRISTDSLRCKVENTEAGNITGQVWNFLSSPSKNSYGEVNSQMKNMCQRLQLFSQQINILGLQTVSGRISRRTPTTSIVNQSVMVGRKDDQEKLTNMLLSDNGPSNTNIGVVTILGMGGVGKTTLAQLLYNNKQVQEHFDLRAWACVSEDFDILRVTKTLIESVTSRAYETNNLDFLRVELKQKLRDKRFLFVMDDLWNEKYNDWDELLSPLVDGKAGSKVIITTRQEKVAEVTRTFPIHKLDLLSVEDCWSLLSKHAFGSEDCHGSKYQHLEEIGRKIAKKCGGLPIAAKTLGGLLRSKADAKHWTTILNSNIWDLRDDDILPALRLSYQFLPSHLKRCFAYCSIFPKDHPLDRKQLVLLWMAEGFLENSQEEKALEEVGDDYFAELLSRSLIQHTGGDASGEEFVMHDLVNDLATVVSRRSCCRLECGEISEDVHHFSYKQEFYDISKKFSYKFKCLRTFLSLGSWWQPSFLSRKVVDDLLPTFGRLRVLSLSGYKNITVLPNSIGSLVHLRYIDLSYTGIKCLPDTTCNLYNLQTLILSNCVDLTELPLHIGKLVNLRHLDISETKIRELPKQILGLQNLKSLTVFVVSKQEVGLSVRELRKFPHLQGKLSILNLHNVIDPMEAHDANLKNKQIEELVLEWGEQTKDTQKEKAVIDELQPSANLKTLVIKSYGGTSFPSWLGASSFSNIVSVHIVNCEYCITLPPLGQLPCLKKLTVSGMALLDTVGQEFYGMAGGGSFSLFQPFPSLEYLEFKAMPNWKEWLPSESGELPFPCLKTLILINCPKLRGHLPSHLSSIEEIKISNCDHLLATPPTLHWLSSIKKIRINSMWRVPELSTKRTQWSLLESDTSCLLKDVQVRHCASLPKMIVSSSCLRLLELYHCPSLTTFPEDGLPTSLKTLKIDGCKDLAFLPPETWRNYTSLRDLTIRDSCDALTSFPLDGFPELDWLWILGCSSLESICISESSSLRPSTLQTLLIRNCKALRSLPQRMDSLTFLTLEGLPELEFPPFFTLPPKLRSFLIDSPRQPPQGITEWGLQRLTSLSFLRIGGDDIVNAMLEGRLLPISLVDLNIKNLSHTKSLEGNGLRHLSSLEELGFYGCPMLESLPEDQLPSSLKRLSIRDCPLLEERYESQRGEHWSKIAHIPVLKINEEVTIT